MYHAKCTMRTDYSLNLPMESASILIRAFDKSPMRTESEISALTFSNTHTILTIEEDGLLSFWNINTNQEQIKKGTGTDDTALAV
ncbi:MAG: hypothetical protein EBQ87_07895 [Planctomycetes bacterium]|nr:hypothetical protein [Planctomycetota bacterium]